MQNEPVYRAPATGPVAALRRVALPHLRALTDRVAETTNAMVVDGDDVRFVASAECDQVLRDRLAEWVGALRATAEAIGGELRSREY